MFFYERDGEVEIQIKGKKHSRQKNYENDVSGIFKIGHLDFHRPYISNVSIKEMHIFY
jgi:hypothetical protein